MTKNAYL